MAYTLGGSTIKSPTSMNESNTSQYAQQRTLDGSINRDYFGSNKRIWVLQYRNLQKTDFDTINSVYQTYLSSSNPVTWVSTETNYAFSTTAHVDLNVRQFNVGGESYLSDITLVLTEA